MRTLLLFLLSFLFFFLIHTQAFVDFSTQENIRPNLENDVLRLPPKNLPTSFYDPNVTTIVSGLQGNGPMFYSEPDRATLVTQGQPLFVGYPLNWTQLQTVNGSYFITNDVCRLTDYAGSFISLWSFVPYSRYNGQLTLPDGRVVDEWVLRYDGGLLVLDVLASNPNVPVRFIAPITQPFISNFTYLWSDQLDPNHVIDPDMFEPPRSCFEMEVCEEGPTKNLTLYLFHGANDFTLINTNVADQLGDVGFVCIAVISGDFPYFSWISEYTIQVNTTFGQYGLCNFGVCLGGSEERVGKEATEGLSSDLGGQCTPNTEVGNWFSLPPFNSTLCPDYGDGPIGVNGAEWYGCGWSVVEKVKTINGSCLIDQHEFVNSGCLVDRTFPFPTASKIWEAAFASDDPAQGGCPDISSSTSNSLKSSEPTTTLTTKTTKTMTTRTMEKREEGARKRVEESLRQLSSLLSQLSKESL